MKPQKEIETLLKRAEQIAREHNHEYMYTEHVALAMLDEEKFTNMLQDFGIEVHEFKDDLKQHMVTKIPQVKKSPTPMVKTQSVERIFNRSLTQVLFNGISRRNKRLLIRF